MRLVEYSAKDVSKFWISMWALWLLMLSACTHNQYPAPFDYMEAEVMPSKVGNK